MKLAELSSLSDTRTAELSDLQNELGHLLYDGSGSEEDVASAGQLLRRTMELWDETDEMMAHVLSIKSRINIPQLGMSILDAEIVADSFASREAYVEALIDALNENLHDANPGLGSEDTEERGANLCVHCGHPKGLPIQIADAVALLQAIRNRRTTLRDAVEQASWQVETMWYELDDDAQEMSSTSVSEAKPVDPVEALGIGELPGDFLRPAVEETPPPPPPTPSVSTDYEIVDRMCPFCMTPGREAIERIWLREGADTMSIMAIATTSGAVPQNTNPTVARIHFDDHFKASDHFQVPGR